MTCDEVIRSLSEFQDGELPAGTREKVGRHLDACPRCRRIRTELTNVSLLVRAAPQPAMLDGLEAQVRDALRARTGPAKIWARGPMVIAPLVSAAAAAAITALIAGGFHSGDDTPRDPLADALAAHVRSLMEERSTRIVSADPHTVRPWFAGRLPFAPPAPDLSAAGYPLIGARLDYLGERLVAALVYRRRQHVINVFIWPQAGSGDGAQESASLRQGYNLVGWQTAGLAYVAISDLNAEELGTFRSLFAATLPER